ncbi:hypothetical protein SAMN05421678_10194 [Actinopolymorpha cephalotaxi]|uniref:Uncharacterized protein n=1 Tax=Actinopolymorpha cephalotaxi TaxID=504797 RepID=A0A1I2K9F4_9ACTN|nr:DUF6223 family protein [Actinopolymorpha cephalotaxi]NYH85893.1 hypothetical protein [Actinopolymorpha cephalotaxi]SFF62918.1 hypothetical protein SAMN05421678_10194 [Actinopolymorpha cephalotaxi]
MFVPHLIAGFVPAQPAAPGAYTLTAGRSWAMVAMALGVAGAIAGGLALANRAGTVTRRRRALAALVAGSAGTVVGGLVVAAADGGPGTGYGIVGGVLALPVGLAAMLLGGLALARVRRTVSSTAGTPG